MWTIHIISFLDGHTHRRIDVRNEDNKRVMRLAMVRKDQYNDTLKKLETAAAERGLDIAYEFETRTWG